MSPRTNAARLSMLRKPSPGLASKDFLSVLDVAHDELEATLDLAAELKRARAARRPGPQPLVGHHVALLFEKPSLRTRSTFVIGVRELGGQVIEPPADVALGGRESLEDVARNLERWVSISVVVRSARRASRSLPPPRPTCTSSTRSPTKSIHARPWPTC